MTRAVAVVYGSAALPGRLGLALRDAAARWLLDGGRPDLALVADVRGCAANARAVLHGLAVPFDLWRARGSVESADGSRLWRPSPPSPGETWERLRADAMADEAARWAEAGARVRALVLHADRGPDPEAARFAARARALGLGVDLIDITAPTGPASAPAAAPTATEMTTGEAR